MESIVISFFFLLKYKGNTFLYMYFMLKSLIREGNMKKHFKSFSIYTILFFIISGIVFSAFILDGKSLLLKMDAFNQHFVVFKNYHEIIRNGFSLFSWNISLGEGIIGQYAYYVIGDPFFYLSLPFSAGLLKYVYSFLIFLRIYCIGLSFFTFCKYKKENDACSILGSLVYAFSSYSLLNSLMHPFFANAAILFPLLLIAVEKFLKEENCKYVILLFFLSIVCNFYFCYVLLILSFLYAILYYWLDKKDKSIKDFMSKIFKAAGCFIVAVLLSSFILLPILYAFLNSGRVISDLSISYDLSYFKSLLSNLFIIKESPYSTTIGVSSLVLLCLPFVFKDFKNNKSLIVYFIILSCGLLVPIFGSVLNGFSYTSNRWTFAYCFVLSYFVVRGIKVDLKYTLKDIGVITFLIFGYLIFTYIFNNNSLILVFKSLSLVIIILIGVFIFRYIKFKKFIWILLGLVFILNIGYMGRIGLDYWFEKCVDYNDFEYTYNSMNGDFVNYNEALAEIKTDNDFYRIGRYPRWFQNSSQYFDYMSSSSYLSISNKYLKQLSDDLNNFDVEVSKPLLEFDNRTRITSLFGVKYFVTNKRNSNKIPYGYYKSFSKGDLEVYVNKFYSLPVSFYKDTYLYDDWMKESVLDREYLLTKTAVLEKDEYESLDIQKNNKDYNSIVDEIDYKVVNRDLSDNKIEVKNDGESIIFNFKNPKDSEAYLYIKNLKFIPQDDDFSYQLKFRINGITNVRSVFDYKNSPYYYPMEDIYLNLGCLEGKNKVEWVFSKKGTYYFDEIKILSSDMKSYQTDINHLSEDILFKSFDKNSISVDVSAEVDGVLQLSSGFSKGWTAYVDGKKVDTFLVNRGFVGIHLTTGNHEVMFKYETPYLKIGMLISGLTLCGISLVYFRKRKRVM